MTRLAAAVCLGLVGLILVVPFGVSGDKDKKIETKVKGMLPAGWKGLKLEASQKEKIYEIQKMYRTKIDALEDQIAELKAQEKGAMFKVLTEDQKTLLRKIITGEDTKDKAVVKDGDKKDKKVEEKKEK